MKFWRSYAKRINSPTGARTAAPNNSIYLGRYHDETAGTVGEEIFYSGERHLLLFGPNGSGKGMRILAPNLLTGLRNQSVVVIDPKGELAAITADSRRKMGHKVVILNPFNVLGLGSAGFNPLASLDPAGPQFFDDAAGIGEALVKIQGNEPHWSESARSLITALIMWEKLRSGKNAALGNVRAMLTEPDEYEIEESADGKLIKRQVSGLRITARKMVLTDVLSADILESLASRFMYESKEISGIQSAADTQTQWMLSPLMREDLAKDGINFSELKDRPITVYVVLPAERLRTHSVWLRLVIVSALRSLYKPGRQRTLLIVDEAAALDHLAPLEDALGLVRGYGVQIAAIFQDITQLQAIYQKRWETFVANAGAVMGFAPNDLTTARWMSERSGPTTVVALSCTTNTGISSGKESSSSSGSGLSEQQIGRQLFLPHDLFGFEEGTGVVWRAGMNNGIRFFAPYYTKIAECKKHAAPNPYRRNAA